MDEHRLHLNADLWGGSDADLVGLHLVALEAF